MPCRQSMRVWVPLEVVVVVVENVDDVGSERKWADKNGMAAYLYKYQTRTRDVDASRLVALGETNLINAA